MVLDQLAEVFAPFHLHRYPEVEKLILSPEQWQEYLTPSDIYSKVQIWFKGLKQWQERCEDEKIADLMNSKDVEFHQYITFITHCTKMAMRVTFGALGRGPWIYGWFRETGISTEELSPSQDLSFCNCSPFLTELLFQPPVMILRRCPEHGWNGTFRIDVENQA